MNQRPTLTRLTASSDAPTSGVAGSLVLVALKYAPVHRLCMLAYREAYERCAGRCTVTWVVADEYAPQLPATDGVITVGPGRNGRDVAKGFARQLFRFRAMTDRHLFGAQGASGPTHVFIQATHPANSFLVKRIRAMRPDASIRYYLHEPTSWWQKIRKGDGLLNSTFVYLSQLADLRCVDAFYVAHRRGLEWATRAFPIAGISSRGRLLRLPLRDLCPHFSPISSPPLRQVLFLGRADQMRCTDLFMRVAAEADRRKLGWSFVLLTGLNPDVPSWARNLPNLRLQVGRAYSDEEMAAELDRSRFVFNLYRVPYTQSGVTPVALMFGVPVIAHVQEHEPELEASGCVYLEREPTAAELLAVLEQARPMERARLRKWYLEHYDAGTVKIPDLIASPRLPEASL